MDARYPSQGILTWSDGRRYEGEFLEDEMSGEGKYTWPDGREYRGEFKSNKMNGQGIRRCTNEA